MQLDKIKLLIYVCSLPCLEWLSTGAGESQIIPSRGWHKKRGKACQGANLMVRKIGFIKFRECIQTEI